MSISIETLRDRHRFMRSLREYFDSQGFLEIETPYLLEGNTPDPHIDPLFVQAKFPRTQEFQLHTSPEIWLKKALALGVPNLYEIARVFRDDPPGRAHAKEFTMIEWYRSRADLIDLLDDCQNIFELAHNLDVQSQKASWEFKERTIEDLFREHAQIDLLPVLEQVSDGNYLKLNIILAERGDLLPQESNFVDAFFHVMIKYVEPNLDHQIPTVITRWPVQLAALAAPSPDNSLFCERFEIYYRGLEIANAYQECFDPQILRDRFQRENQERKNLKKPVFSIDNEFLEALRDHPKTAGIALGIDRLLMAVMKKAHLRDLIWGFCE